MQEVAAIPHTQRERFANSKLSSAIFFKTSKSAQAK